MDAIHSLFHYAFADVEMCLSGCIVCQSDAHSYNIFSLFVHEIFLYFSPPDRTPLSRPIVLSYVTNVHAEAWLAYDHTMNW